MSTWIVQHFLNSALFWPGVALTAVPVIIHLINRLRFRRVRFAAMEFLLASEQRNRRRILFEQLLLLLMRIIIVLLILALIGRLTLDPEQLSLFQGSQAHHVVILDDSGSMQDRLGDESCFDAAKSIVQRLVNEGAQRPGTQKFTLLRMSRPLETTAGLSEREVNENLLKDVVVSLEALKCTHQSFEIATALEAARARLTDDKTSSLKLVHLITDARRRDWYDDKTLATVVRALSKSDIAVNLVRVVGEHHDNLAISDFSGTVETAAAGVPISLQVRVANYGNREAKNVRVAVKADDHNLPMNLVLETIAAGQQQERSFEVVFEQAGPHRVQVSLESDALESDNTRYLAIDVPQENPILIIEGTPEGDDGLYIADALAADKSVTGFATSIQGPDDLRKTVLDKFRAIYLVNVAELAPDALDPLQRFVKNGGGLAWFLGDSIRPTYYNDKLFEGGKGLFPARLATAPALLPREEVTIPGPDVITGSHPIFKVLTGEENPFIDTVFVNHYYPLDEKWLETEKAESQARVIVSLRNKQPLFLEHSYGDGRVITCLTAAGTLTGKDGLIWSNWASGPAAPSYAVMQLELTKHIARRDRILPRRIVGEPIREVLPPAVYRDEVEVISPDGQQSRLKAASERPPEPPVPGEPPPAPAPLIVIHAETDAPGVFTVVVQTQDRNEERRLYAYNVPPEESRLELATEQQIRKLVGDDVPLQIQAPGQFDWLRARPAGQEMRWWILAALLLLFVCEQALALRLSYHPV